MLAPGVATLLFVNDGGMGQDVAPPGGLAGRMSTNPIAAGVPRAQALHLVFDIATSTVAMGRLSEWRDREEEIPPEWVTPSGHLKHFGGYKGFGLALIAEALGGALSTAGVASSSTREEQQGVLMIAIDVAGLRALDAFTEELEGFIRHIKNTPVEEGAPPVRVPGENTASTTQRRRRDGVPVKPFTWQALERLSADLGVRMPVPAGFRADSAAPC